MDIEIFVFSVEAFLFSEFYKNEAKHDKCIFKRGLNIAFKVKNELSCWKNRLKFLQAYSFWGAINPIIGLNTSKITLKFS